MPVSKVRKGRKAPTPVSGSTAATAQLFAQVEPGYVYTAPWDMRGYRLESVGSDGSIGSYEASGVTPDAVCHSTPLEDGNGYAPGITHGLPCSCGYRIVQSKQQLGAFVELVTKSQTPGSMSVFTNHAFSEAAGDYSGVALVECAIPKGATLTARNLEDAELPGTYRTTSLKLGKKVVMPRRCGQIDQTLMAEMIRRKHGIDVEVLEMDGLEFTNWLNSPERARKGAPEAHTGEGWHPCGEWGLFGAAGVLFMTGRQVLNDERYLITRRTATLPNHPGLWGTPGGAVGRSETTLQAATREVEEEMGVPGLAGASIAGAVDYYRDGGWGYTTYLAHVPEPFVPDVDGQELSSSKWVSKEQLEDMAASGELVPAFAEKLFELFELHRTWRSILSAPRGHTLGGWR